MVNYHRFTLSLGRILGRSISGQMLVNEQNGPHKIGLRLCEFKSLADPKGRGPQGIDLYASSGPIFFHFMQFLRKMAKIIAWHPHLWGLAASSGKSWIHHCKCRLYFNSSVPWHLFHMKNHVSWRQQFSLAATCISACTHVHVKWSRAVHVNLTLLT